MTKNQLAVVAGTTAASQQTLFYEDLHISPLMVSFFHSFVMMEMWLNATVFIKIFDIIIMLLHTYSTWDFLSCFWMRC